MRRRWSQEEFAKVITESHTRVANSTPTQRLERQRAGNSRRALRVGRKVDRLEGLPLLDWQLKHAGAPDPVHELAFHPTRQWRADRAWPEHQLILEYEGAVHLDGRHTRGEGFENDVCKYNAAVLLGWRLLRATHRTVRTGQALTETLQALEVSR